MVDYLSLQSYYRQAVKIRDINASVANIEAKGIEQENNLFNVSVIVENPLSAAYSVDVSLNITNSSGAVVNSSKFTGLTLSASSQLQVNVTGINTSTWNIGSYQLKAYVSGGVSTAKTESFAFKPVDITLDSARYTCNGTTEYFNVTIAHPFEDKISYNVSFQLPVNWNTQPASKIINLTTAGNYTYKFNLTSSQANENATINASISYSYLSFSRSKNSSWVTESGTAMPIIEIVRKRLWLLALTRFLT